MYFFFLKLSHSWVEACNLRPLYKGEIQRRVSFRSLQNGCVHKYQKYEADSAHWRGHGHILLRVNYAWLHGAEIHLEEVEFQGGNRREENPCGRNSANRRTEYGVYLKKKLLSGAG